MDITIYTDGACSGNPGPGGWGALIIASKDSRVLKELELKGGEKATTNNRMELTAAIRALESLDRQSKITIHTDSTYVKDGISKWLPTWKLNGWKTAAKKSVKNEDLWKQLDQASSNHIVKWEWVKGHSGHIENARVDILAKTGMVPYQKTYITQS